MPCIKSHLQMRFILPILILSILKVSAISIDSVSVVNPSCPGASDGSLTPAISGSVGTVTYTWTPCCQVGDSVVNAPANSYTLLVEDQAPSSDMWTGDLVDPPQVNISYVQDTFATCNNDGSLGNPPKVILNSYYAVIAAGGTGPYTYTWESNTGSFDDFQDLNTYFTPSVPRNKVNLTVTDSNGCSSYHTFIAIIQNPIISYDFVASSTANGQLNNIQVDGIYDPTGVGYYAWSIYDDAILIDSGDSSSPISDQTGLMSGNYSLVMNFACTSTLWMILPDPVTVTMPAIIKYNDPTDFVTLTGQGPFSYQWAPITDLSDSNAKLPGFQFSPNLPQVYTLTVTDSLGQINSSDITVDALHAFALSPMVACDDVTPTIFPTDGSGPYTYVWDNAMYLNDPNIQTPTISIPDTRQVTFTVTVTDSTGLMGQKNIVVNSEVIEVNYESVAATCSTDGQINTIEVIGTSSGCWTLRNSSGDLIDTGSDIVNIPNQILPIGTYLFEVFCSLCGGSSSITINPPTPVALTLPANIDQCDFDSSDISITGLGSITWQWSPSTYIYDTSEQIPRLWSNAPLPIMFTLTATDQGDCSDAQSVLISGNPNMITHITQDVSCLDQSDAAVQIQNAVTCSWGDGYNGCNRQNLAIGTYHALVTDSCGFITDYVIGIDIPNLLDSDGDEVPDCLDQCPEDPTKTIPGVCGCGLIDIDSDQDGTPDCIDQCPNDPNKTLPEICGCGVPDIDEDMDGFPSCIDLCDTDSRTQGECSNQIVNTVESNRPGISVNLEPNDIAVTYNVSKPDRLVDQIRAETLPLTEVDVDGNIIQSIDPDSLTWRNVLTNYTGYVILRSRANAELDGQIVGLEFIYYFFSQACRIYSANSTGLNYGLTGNIIDCERNDTGYSTEYLAGDSKITFSVTNWPFRSTEHLLRATYRYTSLNGVIESRHTSFEKGVHIIQYVTSTDIKLRVEFLAESILDDSLGPVEILATNENEVAVLFDYFERKMTYDPSLYFLYHSPNGDNPWFVWRAPLIAVGCIVILCLIFTFLGIYSRRFKRIVHGKEYVRVRDLRKVISRHSKTGSMLSTDERLNELKEHDLNKAVRPPVEERYPPDGDSTTERNVSVSISEDTSLEIEVTD